MLTFIVFLSGLVMYLLVISDNQSIIDATQKRLYVFVILNMICILIAGLFVCKAMGQPFTEIDFEYKKIREIQLELKRINDVFRDLGYTWTLEKRDTFMKAETVDPPKNTFEASDEREILEELNLKNEAGARNYQKKYTVTKRKKETEGSEESETETEEEEEKEVHEKREIVEMIFILVEKNF